MAAVATAFCFEQDQKAHGFDEIIGHSSAAGARAGRTRGSYGRQRSHTGRDRYRERVDRACNS